MIVTIIYGLQPKYNSIVMDTLGWAKDPTLTDLENRLANHEALDRQMSRVSVKVDEIAVFNNKRAFKSQRRQRRWEIEERSWRLAGATRREERSVRGSSSGF